jgi:hypothetical protein
MCLRTLQWFGRTNPHLSLAIEIVATVISMHMVTVDITCKNIDFLEYIMKLCTIAVVHRIIQGKKLMALQLLQHHLGRESRQQEGIMCPFLE